MIISMNTSKLLQLHNEERDKYWLMELRPLSLDNILCDYAFAHAEIMSRSYLHHSKIKNILRLGYIRAGENIAYGQPDEETVMKNWLWSPGHRKNILNSKFRYIGIGISLDIYNQIYWCVVFGAKNE